tara:strand:- start:392 stop:655 length:264 start_codon:yes stop_codon:yes gene_type:complete
MKLSNVETKYLIEFLDVLIDKMGDEGCNDFYVECSPENDKLILEINDFYKKGCDGGDIFTKQSGKWLGYNWAIVGFLKTKLEGSYGH